MKFLLLAVVLQFTKPVVPNPDYSIKLKTSDVKFELSYTYGSLATLIMDVKTAEQLNLLCNILDRADRSALNLGVDTAEIDMRIGMKELREACK